MTGQQWAAIVVAFIIGLLLIGSLFVLWGSHDKRHESHDERLAVLEAALNLGGEPAAVVEEATQPMPRVHIQDARTAVAMAREANRPRPTPFPRTEGRHRAG